MSIASIRSDAEYVNDFLAWVEWIRKPMSRAPENPIAMRSTQAVIDCRLEPIRPESAPAPSADCAPPFSRSALLVAGRALKHELGLIGASPTSILTLSACLKLAEAVVDAYANARWAEEQR